ncbi:hypothetical protein [Variovorax sp. WDL1]|uniref:hypothetical protein n=1 Tax=Variovorax sp. WDL1 TaxID=207745 RepID=UPI0008396679|nr:hypothetical protein [Variovorax sp. WDL1]
MPKVSRDAQSGVMGEVVALDEYRAVVCLRSGPGAGFLYRGLLSAARFVHREGIVRQFVSVVVPVALKVVAAIPGQLHERTPALGMTIRHCLLREM